MTLEGTKDDWVNIWSRLDKLDSFGEEPKHWAVLLRAVLSRFIKSFDVYSENSPSSPKEIKEKAEMRKFWNCLAHHEPTGTGSPILSGWITSFCVWTERGNWVDSCVL